MGEIFAQQWDKIEYKKWYVSRNDSLHQYSFLVNYEDMTKKKLRLFGTGYKYTHKIGRQ